MTGIGATDAARAEQIFSIQISNSQDARNMGSSLRAKRSNPALAPKNRKLDCFVALLLAMTARYGFAFPRRDTPESLTKFVRPELTRAWGMPGADAPAAARGV
jgi:hypothetical protein